jgi:serine/threonine protein kinase
MSDFSPDDFEEPSPATNSALARERELDEIIKRWDNGEPADAVEILRRRPHLARYRSAVVTLALEEYCQRLELGEAVDKGSFIDRFPEHKTAVRKVLLYHELGFDDPRVPRRLETGQVYRDDYEVVESLGRGAFSRVYLARDKKLGRPVVLKITKLAGNEARVMAQVDSPHVVTVYSSIEDGEGEAAIIMPFFGPATFEDLAERLKNGSERRGQLILDVAATRTALEPLVARATLPTEYAKRTFLEGAVWLLRGVAEGISKAHEAGYMHRDLKPSNILLAAGGCPMLADFNLSQRADEQADSVGGTVPYMAPEQLRRFVESSNTQSRQAGDRQPKVELTPKADVYSFGVIAHELLTGRHPHGPIGTEPDPNKLAELLLKKFEETPREPTVCPGANPSLRRLIDACLSVDPALRPTSQEVRDRLNRELKKPACVVRSVVRRPWTTALAAVALLLMLAAGAYAVVSSPTKEIDQVIEAIQRGDLETLTKLADDALRRGDLERGTELAKAILKINPNHLKALKLKAKIAIELGNVDEAIRVLRPLIDSTADTETQGLYAYACALAKKHPEAVPIYNKLYDSGDRTTVTLNNLVRMLILSGRFREAAGYFDEPALRNSIEPAVLFNLAYIEAMTAQFDRSYVPNRGLDAALKAATGDQTPGELLFLTARLRVYVSRSLVQNEADIIRDLRLAKKNGVQNSTLLEERLFEPFRKNPGYAEIAEIKGDEMSYPMVKLMRPY